MLPHSVVGNASDAQAILQTIATSVVTLTSIVLTVTLVAVQLAMGQFSPRIVRALLDDRGDQVAVAIFAATFASRPSRCAASRRASAAPSPASRSSRRSPSRPPAASPCSCTCTTCRSSCAWAASSSSSATTCAGSSTAATRAWPAPTTRPSSPPAPRGNVVHVDHERLVAEARRAGCTLELVPAMGDFVPRGAPLLRADRPLHDRERLLRLVRLEDERSHPDDPAYGVRKLVDVAQRALGTSSNDATTATQAINRLHDCLRQIADRPFPSGRFHDEAGELRLVVRMLRWDGYVRLAFDEIRLAAPGYPQVTRRLVAAIEDLKAIAPPDRHPPARPSAATARARRAGDARTTRTPRPRSSRTRRASARAPTWPAEEARKGVGVAIDDGARLILIDPIAVPDDLRTLFGAREVVTVLTSTWHERDAAALGYPVWAPAPDRPEDQLVPATRYAIGDTLFGMEAYPGREGQLDLVLWNERIHAVIAGDTLINLGSGLEIPAAWLPEGVTVEQVAAGLRPLLAKPVEFVLPTHGEPAVSRALRRARSEGLRARGCSRADTCLRTGPPRCRRAPRRAYGAGRASRRGRPRRT